MSIKTARERLNEAGASGVHNKLDAMRAEIDELRAENAALLAANLDCIEHYDEARRDLGKLKADAERMDWLNKNIFSREHLDFNGSLHPTLNMWVMFAPKGVQGSARAIIDAAMQTTS